MNIYFCFVLKQESSSGSCGACRIKPSRFQEKSLTWNFPFTIPYMKYQQSTFAVAQGRELKLLTLPLIPLNPYRRISPNSQVVTSAYNLHSSSWHQMSPSTLDISPLPRSAFCWAHWTILAGRDFSKPLGAASCSVQGELRGLDSLLRDLLICVQKIKTQTAQLLWASHPTTSWGWE